MSFNRNRARRSVRLLAFALVFAALGAAPRGSEAFDLKIWPLVDWQSNSREARLRLLGPLVEWSRDAETTSFGVRPLFHVARQRSRESTQGYALYPAAVWRTQAEGFSVRFFGLASYESRGKTQPASPWTRQFSIFPLVFFRHGPQSGTSLSVLPFYGDVEGLLGYDRVQMVLFPLYLRLVEPLHERTWLPFPFLSRVGGRLGRGTRLWPVYGRTALGQQSDTTYAAWPIYIRHVDHPGRADQVTTRVSWPFFSVIDGSRLQSRSYGYLPLFLLPAYTHTLDRAAQTETWGFPWPFWTLQRSTETREQLSLRLTPFYQDRRTPTLRSVFYGWPFYRRREGLGDDAGYHRTDVIFFLYRDQYEGDGRHRRHTRVVFPLWKSQGDDAGIRSQSLTLLDGLFPANEAIADLYAPLYRFYGSRVDAQGTSVDILWRMWEWGPDELRPPLYLSRN